MPLFVSRHCRQKPRVKAGVFGCFSACLRIVFKCFICATDGFQHSEALQQATLDVEAGSYDKASKLLLKGRQHSVADICSTDSDPYFISHDPLCFLQVKQRRLLAEAGLLRCQMPWNSASTQSKVTCNRKHMSHMHCLLNTSTLLNAPPRCPSSQDVFLKPGGGPLSVAAPFEASRPGGVGGGTKRDFRTLNIPEV